MKLSIIVVASCTSTRMYPFATPADTVFYISLYRIVPTNHTMYVWYHTLNITIMRFLASSLSSLGQRNEAFSGSWSDKRTRNEKKKLLTADRPTDRPTALVCDRYSLPNKGGRAREVTPKSERFPHPSPPNKRSRLLKKSE